jgi:Na+-transporting NADH:ubiquinone oxidoreductase subunit C
MAAVFFKPMQMANVLNDRRMNILLATGDFKKENLDKKTINEIFDSQIQDRIIDLETGEDVTAEYYEGVTDPVEQKRLVAEYDAFKTAKSKNPEVADELDRKQDIAKVKWKEKRAHIYIYTSKTGEKKYIFPVRGYGLWSTLQGFFALKDDYRSIAGLTYFDHKETPGLGGEVDNPNWKRQWTQNKYLTDEEGNIRIRVIQPESDPKYKVDALSGATITSRGVENMIHFWMGENGYGKFLDRQQAESSSSNSNSPSSSEEDKNG